MQTVEDTLCDAAVAQSPGAQGSSKAARRAAMTAVPDEALPESVGRYRVSGRLGQGGMGEVFAAYDPHLERTVAIKSLRRELALDNGELEHEARLAARFEHANIVRVYDFITVEGIDYIVSEYVGGASLRQIVDQRKLCLRDALDIALQVGAGIACAHDHGVLHRDLKSENVLITGEGVAKITDFGISALMAESTSSIPVDMARAVRSRSETGTEGGDGQSTTTIYGTARCMSPEQTWGGAADARSDLFAFGVLLYELLAQRSPFAARSTAATIERVRTHAQVPLRERDPQVPAELSDLVQSLLAKSADERPSSFADVLPILRAQYDSLGGGVSEAAGASAWQRKLVSVAHCRLVLGASGGSIGWQDEDYAAIDEFQSALTRATREFGGRILSGIGRGAGTRALIVVGIPQSYDNATQRVAKIVWNTSRAISQKYKNHHRVQAGIAVGSIAYRGDDTAPELVGPAVDLAIGLSESAASGQLLVAEGVQRMLGESFNFDRVGMCQLSDFDAEVPTYKMVGEHNRMLATRPTSREAIVGRERELQLLLDNWQRAESGAGRVCLVRGEAGIGKSRLTEALWTTVGARGRIMAVRASALDRHSPLAPFKNFIAREFAVPVEVDAAAARQLVYERSRAMGLELWVIDALANLIGVADDAQKAEFNARPEEDRRNALITAVVRYITSASDASPSLLVVEDLHWLDHSSQRVLVELGQNAAHKSMLVVCTARPQFMVTWAEELELETIELEALDAAGAMALISSLPGSDRLPRATIDALIARAEGHPLLLRELCRTMVERSEVEGDSSKVELVLPGSLRETIAARTQRLGSGRALVEMAAVIGRESSPELLRIALGLSARQFLLAMSQAESAGLMRELALGSERSCVFNHALFVESIIEDMSRERSYALRESIVAALDGELATLVQGQPERYAQHYELSERYERAARLWLSSGTRARGNGAFVETVEHCEAALRNVDAMPVPEAEDRAQLEREIRQVMGAALIGLEGWGGEGVEKNCARSKTLAISLGETLDLAELYQGYSNALLRHESAQVDEIIGQIEALPQTPQQEVLVAGTRGITAIWRGEFALGRRLCLRAAQAGEKLPVDELLALGEDLILSVHHVHAIMELVSGDPQAAARLHATGTQLAERGTAYGGAFSALHAVYQALIRGDHDEVARCAGALRERTDPAFLLFVAVADIGEGSAMVAQGHYSDAGIEMVEKGIAGFLATGGRLSVPMLACIAVQAGLQAGRPEMVREWLELAEATTSEALGGFYRPEVARLQAESIVASALAQGGLGDGARARAHAELARARASIRQLSVDGQPSSYFLDRLETTRKKLDA